MFRVRGKSVGDAVTGPIRGLRDEAIRRLLVARRTPWEAGCPIGWQPSVYAPVFYGYRDHTIETYGSPTLECRVFFPSLDGSPPSAPILRGCGRYPLVVFAHGHCDETDPDHYKAWWYAGAVLARSGYVVIFPDLPNTRGGTFPSQNDEDLERIGRLIKWARAEWEHRDVLMDEPATGLAGHSFGAALSARVVTEGLAPVAAHASLSGANPDLLKGHSLPKLLTWGLGAGEELLVPDPQWESKFVKPIHVAEFHGAGHWDYVRGTSACQDGLGACELVPILAADLLATFFGRYMLPERWADDSWWPPAWPPLFKIPSSLAPPFLLLTTEQKFFAGGHFAAWKMLDQKPACKVTLSWKTDSGSGSLVKG